MREKEEYSQEENQDISIAEEARIPEERLLAAVLERAIRDVISFPGEVREIHRFQSKVWLRRNNTEAWSFRWVCEHLKLDPHKVRAAIKNLPKNYATTACEKLAAMNLLEEKEVKELESPTLQSKP